MIPLQAETSLDSASDDLAPDACFRAVQTRDTRFDGRFFSGVKTTGVYCRPICPARTPLPHNLEFYPSAAAAEAAGYRACLRCRPETAPGMGAWRGTSNTVNRGLELIEAGALDRGDMESLAQRLGLGQRQIRRLFHQHLGASPSRVAQTHRTLLAKTLIHDSSLSMADIALASGFGSVRRFNETFQALYGRPPTTLRRAGRAQAPSRGLSLSLPWHPPLDWGQLIGDLALRGDRVIGGRWVYDLDRSIDATEGRVIAWHEAGNRLSVEIDIEDLRRLPSILVCIRRVFDLSANPVAIGRHLSLDPALAPLINLRPGLRLPGLWTDHAPPTLSDRLPDAFDHQSVKRLESWRPWRAYGLLHLRHAGLSVSDLAGTQP